VTPVASVRLATQPQSQYQSGHFGATGLAVSMIVDHSGRKSGT
jgi:hypothetical protein